MRLFTIAAVALCAVCAYAAENEDMEVAGSGNESCQEVALATDSTADVESTAN